MKLLDVTKGLAIGVLAYGLSMPFFALNAHALTQTECVGFNSMYDICTVYQYDHGTGQWKAKSVFFRLREEPIVHQ